jgi:hypothetical protein
MRSAEAAPAGRVTRSTTLRRAPRLTPRPGRCWVGMVCEAHLSRTRPDRGRWNGTHPPSLPDASTTPSLDGAEVRELSRGRSLTSSHTSARAALSATD